MEISAPLLQWYENNKRDLPWRHSTDPYRIWVSEIMLQQTRAAAVIPYYTRFFEVLPDIYALAACPEEKLFKLWEGLGYYSRARNLKKCAEVIIKEHGGRFPEDEKTLRALPGIGAYTAGAVASIAFHKPVPAVDGNVMRVLARVLRDGRNILAEDTKKDFTAFLLTQDLSRAGELNQAFMDLGTAVCLPKAPLCERCPLKKLCLARAAGETDTLPYREKAGTRKKEQLTVFCLATEKGYLLHRRERTGLLAGLYELPNVKGWLDTKEAMAVLSGWGYGPLGPLMQYERKHVFTHIEWEMRVFACRTEAKENGGFLFSTGREALPTAFKKCLPEAGAAAEDIE